MTAAYREALFYVKSDGGVTTCALCPRMCRLNDGDSGVCLARRNEGGALRAFSYGRISSLCLDPVEKKPFRHFHPGSAILSAGSFGCNFTCPFCQNHTISRAIPETGFIAPETLADMARSARVKGNIGLAYTYNEPIVSYEYVLETAEIAHKFGLLNAMVTNGYIEPEPLSGLLPHMDALNVDLKGDGKFYTELCGGRVDVVLRTIRSACSAGRHVEVTTLLVSGRNDNIGAVIDVSKQISAISEDIPLHLTRFYPRYHMSGAPPTAGGFLREAAEAARAYLRYVYI